MTVLPVSGAAPAVSDAGSLQPKNLKQAATQFEAMMISQLLKSVHQSDGGGWMGTGDDESSSSMMEMAEDQLAQVMSSQGGMGLANMVMQKVGAKEKPAAAQPPAHTAAAVPGSHP